MAASTPLHENELIDCVRANIGKDIATVAERAGYGENIEKFEKELKKAYESIGVDIETFDTLKQKEQEKEREKKGVEIAPETPSQL
ncbi:hypothetical protein [Crocosphaera subtropica]|nr:hypothetical protein [Crocosphaera subtropica]